MCAMAFVSEHQEQFLNNKPPMDRISSLPDEILITILNFLPTKSAFITTTLSKRWNYLFEEVNQLDFDDSLSFNNASSLNHDTRCVAFRAFIRKLLLSHELPNLIRLRIKCAPKCKPPCFTNSIPFWFSVILSCGIQEVDLCIDTFLWLPEVFFTCKTLCILKVDFFAVLGITVDVCMPHLKILHMRQIRPVDDDIITRIFSGCPLLSDFYMEPFSFYRDAPISISCPSVTKLKLAHTEEFNLSDSTRTSPRVTIVAPLLQCFHYIDNLASNYSVQTSENLVKARLEIFTHMADFEDMSAISRSAFELIQGVSTVKCLFLSTHFVEALTFAKDLMPVLRYLTKLELACCTNLHVTMPKLLNSAPCLEQLIFSEGLFPVGFKDKDTEREDNWRTQQVVPSCMETHLKIIKIKHFLGLKEERRIVDYFLSNSHVLSQLVIHEWLGTKNKLKVRKQLKKLARRRNKCVDFSDLYL